MLAMLLRRARCALKAEEVAVPEAQPGQVLIKVCACAVCRTDLHVSMASLPIRSCR